MVEILYKIIPIVSLFFLGYVLKAVNFLKKQDADLFLKIVFYISLPALILLSVSRIILTREFVYLPLIAPIIIFVTYLISFITGKLIGLNKKTFGAFLVGSMILNISFVLPFVIAAYGEEGLALISLFDLGNGSVVLTFVYYLATKFGGNTGNSKNVIKKFLYSVPIWALLVALIVNLGSMRVPLVVTNILQTLGSLLTPLLMLSIGIYFSPKVVKFVPTALGVFIRSFLGLLIGLILVNIFSLGGLVRSVVLVGSAAPVGFNTLTFSSLEKLDKEFAASLVSVSILIGIFFIPVLIALLA